MANILAVDDDRDLCTLLKTALERDGHTVETRTSGTQLTDTLCRWADCILLDVMMPGEDGFAVCRRIRAETDAPILFLTARTDEPSVLTGLGLGADDYLTKPFRIAELRARVAAHLRRQNRTPSHKITRGGVALDLSAKEAHHYEHDYTDEDIERTALLHQSVDVVQHQGNKRARKSRDTRCTRNGLP